MVRTYPVASPHFDPARVAAWSAAIALHLLAFLLLLIPATYQAVQAPREKSPVRLIEKIPPPPAPPVPGAWWLALWPALLAFAGGGWRQARMTA